MEEPTSGEGAPALRRGGRGGRAPRPQAPVRAAPASVDVDLTSQCKNASLPTNLLDNIAMSCDA